MHTAVAIGVLSAVIGTAAAPAPSGDSPSTTQSDKAVKPPAGNKHARARLVANLDSIAPGGEVLVGLTFEIDEGWYLYWRGQNDSGMPIDFKLTAPEGYTVGKIIWPAPDRYVLPGDLVDYIYRKEVTLTVPIKASRDVKVPLTVDAEVEFLVCEEACVPGSYRLQAVVPLAKPGEVPRYAADAAVLERAQKRWPSRPGSISDFTVSWMGEELLLEGRLSEKITFMPEQDSATLIDSFRTGEVKGDANGTRLALRFTRAEGPTGDRVRGFVRVDEGQRGVSYLWIDEPLPKKGS